jgi:hypothetical protein
MSVMPVMSVPSLTRLDGPTDNGVSLRFHRPRRTHGTRPPAPAPVTTGAVTGILWFTRASALTQDYIEELRARDGG